jgi:hypothetical protein
MEDDDEFDDFLRKRRRLFGPVPGDELEPPAELDRIVLGRAREAIETPRPQRMFRAPSWSLPVALAATLVLTFTVILPTVKTPNATVATVGVEQVARRVEPAPEPMAPAAVPASAPAAAPAAAMSAPAEQRAEPGASSDSVVVDIGRKPALVSEAEAKRYAAPSPPAPALDWRRDSKSWLAEIERLRASGDSKRANAELAEYKKTYGAYATAPDR